MKRNKNTPKIVGARVTNIYYYRKGERYRLGLVSPIEREVKA
ncbi:hypothetical protein [Candidatus Stoquefichus sp. SB1]|jgi:hypothetical protein|uniref:Uncharacterized protein n=1 Tax=Caudovirales sp. ct7oE3 TaxID=2826768 RepID=A0A8S5LZS9_9CAUD|nr:hypothetical protein [Candidatus Stoquefichus sp. SB1]DAD75384.1 MAG TPA: hypothetical protein [Caudovirales sp. ct7oE3]